MAKADMIKEAKDLGIQLEGNETISDLSDLIEEAKASAPADLKGPIPEGAPPEPAPEDKQVGGVVLRRFAVAFIRGDGRAQQAGPQVGRGAEARRWLLQGRWAGR